MNVYRSLALMLVSAVALVGCDHFSEDKSDPPVTVEPNATTEPTVAANVIVRWVDGDTVELSSDRTVRLLGVDTPETQSYGGGNECVNLALADKATARANEIAPSGSAVTLEAEGTDRYGRILAELFTVDGTNIGDQLVADNLARRWPDGPCLEG